ncbi:uncharacterized protein [Ptychodera flava]|uniref:uncharacterized protein n=1 Tax=Ptychodera flava TaxID=63121 RepID=UPI00396A8F57
MGSTSLTVKCECGTSNNRSITYISKRRLARMANLQAVTKDLFQKAKKLADSIGWSVFVKVVSPNQPGEFYGTVDLTEKYRQSGLQLEQGECEVDMNGDRVAVMLSEQEAIVQELEELKSAREKPTDIAPVEPVQSSVLQLKHGDCLPDKDGKTIRQDHQPSQVMSATETPVSAGSNTEADLSTALTSLQRTLQGSTSGHEETKPNELMTAVMAVMKCMPSTEEGRAEAEQAVKKEEEVSVKEEMDKEDDDPVGDQELIPGKATDNARGRRRTKRPMRYVVDNAEEAPVTAKRTGRGRGRPRKYPDCVVEVNIEKDESAACQDNVADTVDRVKPKKRGRPRKHVLTMLDEGEELKATQSAKTRKHMYVCKECNQSFTSVANLQTHFNKHSGVKPHSCDICEKKFLHYNSLRVHKLTHTGEKPFACDQCNKTFALANTLNDHMKTHTNERPHKCKVCLKGFTQRGSLHSHMRLHTGEKPYQCSYCGKAFAQANGLRTHIMSHTGEKPYKCTLCDKAFNSAFKLKCHKAMHEDKLPYPCELCDKAFTMPCHLKLHHSKYHLKLRPYLCDTCGKDFADSKTLYYHKKIHSDDPKQFVCSHCSRGFHSKSLLIKHERTHTGEKPFACQECGKKFSRSDNLRCHMKIHNREVKEYRCDQCDRICKSAADLKRHQSDFHSVVVLTTQKDEQVIIPTTATEVAATTTTYVLHVDPSVPLPSWASQVQVPNFSTQGDRLPVMASVTLQENATDEEVRSAAAMLLSATHQHVSDGNFT